MTSCFYNRSLHVTGFHLDYILKLRMRAFFWYPPDGHLSRVLSHIALTSSLEFGSTSISVKLNRVTYRTLRAQKHRDPSGVKTTQLLVQRKELVADSSWLADITVILGTTLIPCSGILAITLSVTV